MNIPVIRYDADAASDAYEVHSALLRMERLFPPLKHNSQWSALRREAFERFALAFEVKQ